MIRGGWYTGMYWYRGIELIPFRYIFVRLSYRKPDTDYTVTNYLASVTFGVVTRKQDLN